jgi:predicted MPP superfamily phosphohydrolase
VEILNRIGKISVIMRSREQTFYPMKIIVMTDAHANLPALQAALAAIQAEGYDLIVHTGDAIAIRPRPAETLDLLLATP